MSSKWKYTERKINGTKRRVKVRKWGGKTQVRVVAYRNLTDKTARKYGRMRKKYHYSATDKRKSRAI